MSTRPKKVPSGWRRLAGLLLGIGWVLSPLDALASDSARSAEAPWRLNDHLPDRFSLSVQQRIRYENLSEQFRVGTDGRSDVVVLRTLVHARLRLAEGLHFGAELQDSRAERTTDTRLDTSIVNTAELLRAYVEWQREDVLGGELEAQLGRITMDLGSRRFLARNRYRNTINAFSGIDVRWKAPSGSQLRGFWTMPLRRRPTDRRRLEGNRVQNDEESLDQQFWGLFGSTDTPIGRAEVFLLGLHERDESDRRTRKRQLYTPGFRLFRAPAEGRWDFAWESAVQLGRSRASTTGERLTHIAHFHHFEVGRSLAAPWSPRLAVEYDFASGDEDPGDSQNNRFDTLFGARRFDWGPTGIYGPFARSNLHSPGLRLKLRPSRTLTSFLALRSFWLAERRDAWTTAGLRDTQGSSGRHLGTQFEVRARWDVLPGNLRMEAGYARLFDGEFVRSAPGSNDPGDIDYFYTQASVTF
ncbi:MAG: alginate export family protein [Myxococcales bacterium]|nr:alginate export family protein [Myxococcales bacterium]